MAKQYVRNFGHVLDSAIQGDILVLYQPGKFPLPATTERVVTQLASLFFEHRIDRQPVLSGSQWSGISAELLLAPNDTDDWQPICNFDFPSTNDVRRINAGFLAWENTLAVLGADSLLGFRLIDRGHGFLPSGAYLNIWGAGVEVSEDIPSGGGTIIDSGGNGGNGGQTLTAADIVAMLQSLTGSARLDASAIEGIVSAVQPAGPDQAVQFNSGGVLSGSGDLTFNPVGVPFPGDFLPASSLIYSSSSIGTDSRITQASADLNDGLGTAGFLSQGSSGEWLQVDTGSIRSIDGVRLGGGSVGGSGDAAGILNGATIQVSGNGLAWVSVGTVTGLTNSGVSQFLTFSFPAQQARYVRLTRPVGQLGTTEFRVRVSQNSLFKILSLLNGSLWVSDGSDSNPAPVAGEISAKSLASSTGLKVAGLPSVQPRQTGWTAGTGTALLGAYAAGTATLAQTAQRVLAIEQALRHHGLIN